MGGDVWHQIGKGCQWRRSEGVGQRRGADDGGECVVEEVRRSRGREGMTGD